LKLETGNLMILPASRGVVAAFLKELGRARFLPARKTCSGGRAVIIMSGKAILQQQNCLAILRIAGNTDLLNN